MSGIVEHKLESCERCRENDHDACAVKVHKRRDMINCKCANCWTMCSECEEHPAVDQGLCAGCMWSLIVTIDTDLWELWMSIDNGSREPFKEAGEIVTWIIQRMFELGWLKYGGKV